MPTYIIRRNLGDYGNKAVEYFSEPNKRVFGPQVFALKSDAERIANLLNQNPKLTSKWEVVENNI